MSHKLKTYGRSVGRSVAYLIFGGWHLLFLVILLGVIAPAFVEALEKSRFQDTPWYSLAFILVLVAIPLVSIALGLGRFSKSPGFQLRYLYGFELPLFMLMFYLMIGFRQGNLAMDFMLFLALLSLFSYLVILWQKKSNGLEKIKSSPIWLGFSGLVLMTGIYLGLLLLIILFPYLVTVVGNVFDAIVNFFSHGIQIKPSRSTSYFPALVLIPFALFTIGLVLILPFAMTWLYIRQFGIFLPQLKKPLAWLILAGFLGINVGMIQLLDHQQQQKVFEMLGEQEITEQKKQHLLTQTELIRAGLINAYLSPFRYLSTESKSRSIGKSYRKLLDWSPSQAEKVQQLFNFLIRPMLYQGKSFSERKKAADLYQQFFDTSIEKGEQEQILKSIPLDWFSRGNRPASLLSRNQKRVFLQKQQIDFRVEKGIGNLTLKQALKNLTYRNQEVVLQFRLPEDAVITGLWLSNEEDKPKQFAYVVSPRGAAQKVYNRQIRKRVDPALLEQIGPSEYRLRIYPIPPKRGGTQAMPMLYMQMDMLILADAKGQWQTPRLLEKRNLYWDERSQRVLNGENLSTQSWFPTSLKDAELEDFRLIEFESDGTNFHAIPRQHGSEQISFNNNIAAVVDGSYSMQKHKARMKQVINTLVQSGQQIEWYFCQQSCAMYSAEQILQQSFFGNSTPLEQLQHLKDTASGNAYDAIIYLSDGDSPKSKMKPQQWLNNTPIWLVQPDSRDVPVINDDLMELIQVSQGGVVNSTREALLRLNPQDILAHMTLPTNFELINITRERLWLKSPSRFEQKLGLVAFEQYRLLARQIILSKTREENLTDLVQLDKIHDIAKSAEIVSQFSSMLVLVNEEQHRELKKAETEADRFKRDKAENRIRIRKPNNPLAVSSVPEPEEWMLIICALALLSYRVLRKSGILNGRQPGLNSIAQFAMSR